jgi:hypothetical protein
MVGGGIETNKGLVWSENDGGRVVVKQKKPTLENAQ